MSASGEERVVARGSVQVEWAELLARVFFIEAIDPHAVPLPEAVRQRVCEVLQGLEALPALEATTECFRLLSGLPQAALT